MSQSITGNELNQVYADPEAAPLSGLPPNATGLNAYNYRDTNLQLPTRYDPAEPATV